MLDAPSCGRSPDPNFICRPNAGVPSIPHQPAAQAAADGFARPEHSAGSPGADSSKSSRKGKSKQGLAFNPLPKRGAARSSAVAPHGGMANGTGAAGPHQEKPFLGGPPNGDQVSQTTQSTLSHAREAFITLVKCALQGLTNLMVLYCTCACFSTGFDWKSASQYLAP